MSTLQEALPVDAAPVMITGWALHIPGVTMSELVAGCECEPACPPEHARQLLGSRGLLYKEPATKLALCAVHRALKLPPGSPRRSGAPDARTALVASSNLGNVATVHNVVRTLRHGRVRDVSPLDAPNVSSNVMASMVAIWFRWGGPNLMVCSGATSGLDAVGLGARLLRCGRCDTVVVVGAEPDDEVASALYAERAGPDPAPLRVGAAAVVLERRCGSNSEMPVLGRVRAVAEAGGAPILVGPQEKAIDGSQVIDILDRIGDLYGGMGVAQVAVAAALTARTPLGERKPVGVICGDSIDGWRSVSVS
jgi:3-oxoacyl-[acyl-carrier-protein] synthase II